MNQLFMKQLLRCAVVVVLLAVVSVTARPDGAEGRRVGGEDAGRGHGPRSPANSTDGNWTEFPPFGNFSSNFSDNSSVRPPRHPHGRLPPPPFNVTDGNWTELPPFGNFSVNGSFVPPRHGGHGPSRDHHHGHGHGRRSPVNSTDGNWTEFPPFGNFSVNGSFVPPRHGHGHGPSRDHHHGPRSPVDSTDGNWTESEDSA